MKPKINEETLLSAAKSTNPVVSEALKKILEESQQSKPLQVEKSEDQMTTEKMNETIESIKNPELAQALKSLLAKMKRKPADLEFARALREIREYSVKSLNPEFWDVWKTSWWTKVMKESYTPFTLLIVLLCAFIYLCTWIVDPAVIEQTFPAHISELWCGKIWKGFTCLFIHYNIFHLLFNTQVFVIISRSLEMQFGSWVLLWIMLTSGYIGTVTQSNIRMQDHLQRDRSIVGLSGSICGLLGFGLVAARQRFLGFRNMNPKEKISLKYINRLLWGTQGRSRYWLGTILVLGAISEYFHLPIATWAHFGGLAWGAMIGILMRIHGPQVASMGSCAVFIAILGMNPQPKRSPSWNAFTSSRFLLSGNPEKATFFLKRALRMEDDWSKVLLALCYANTGDNEGAILMAASVDKTKIKLVDKKTTLTEALGAKYLPWFTIDGKKTVDLFNSCFRLSPDGVLSLTRKPTSQELSKLIRTKSNPSTARNNK
eukprot:TRINITY_DN3046_c0_g1_i1.p1 TRINITY_DN3046_c0_g1~~TRINITY_DN3046_c0_g1_i1.p1  ORF type:complete len:554 (+),score=99.02 TRINITY_DN3046_c0_g1_i1:203-1663(+)